MTVIIILRVLMMVLLVFLLLYYDDMLIAINYLHNVNELKIMFGKKFDIKNLSVIKKILSMETNKDNEC